MSDIIRKDISDIISQIGPKNNVCQNMSITIKYYNYLLMKLENFQIFHFLKQIHILRWN